MAKDVEKVTLGTGDLYLNNIEVGHLSGDVEFTFTRSKEIFKPANTLCAVKQFVIGEEAALRASLAEISSANFARAMGVDTADVISSSSFPAYDPSSYSVPASASYDVLTFGGDLGIKQWALRFEHTRPDGKKIIIVLYQAVSETEFNIPFHETSIVLHDVLFKGLADANRARGDQVGVICEQVLSA